MKHHFLLLLFALFIIYGCDCELLSVGRIVDSTTGLPVDSVMISFPNQPDQNVFSDSLGFYEFISFQEGANCTDFELLFRKDGFRDSIFFVRNSISDTTIVELDR